MDLVSHFIFIAVKIAVLAFIYTSFIILLIVVFQKPTSKKGGFKWRRFWLVYKIIAALLLVFSFTYYGYRGFYDEAIIPLGYGEKMRADDDNTYFDSKNNNIGQLNVNTFQVMDAYLCGSANTGLFVYHLDTGILNKFADEHSYSLFAASHGLPLPNQFHDFQQQYNDYWDGWRFWTLP